MENFELDRYHIWRSDFHEIFRDAISQKSPVTVSSHLPLDLCNSADVTLYGKMLALTDVKAQFMVDTYDLALTNAFPPSPQCEYSLAVNTTGPNGSQGKVEYSGRATILDYSLQRNNLPDALLLRITRPNRSRNVRRYTRSECDAGQVVMPGLILVDHAPTSRRALLTLLARYYQRKNRNAPRVINISAGGVCVETRDHGGQRLLSSDEYYLFFFFPEKPSQGLAPHVFLGKKVGIFRRDKNTWPAMRIRFLREMVWVNPAEEIVWKNIEREGSETLSVLLECWKMGSGGE